MERRFKGRTRARAGVARVPPAAARRLVAGPLAAGAPRLHARVGGQRAGRARGGRHPARGRGVRRAGVRHAHPRHRRGPARAARPLLRFEVSGLCWAEVG